MDGYSLVMLGGQIIFMGAILFFVYAQWKMQQGSNVWLGAEMACEQERLERMRSVELSTVWSEEVRPRAMDELEGQEQGLRMLKAALCSSHPQHVIIYGPSGVGKTTAARLVLQEAVASGRTPFAPEAPFIELDGTTGRFDERGIADPLIGSVHDPIFQGAGKMGMAGIPQPKMGAVSKAHGGVLFIDEIGELHPIQQNKLLKVLEDRKVFLESSYYHPEDTRIPEVLHDIFLRGIPADFRLVGATTRGPESIPEALSSEHIRRIVQQGACRMGVTLKEEEACLIAEWSGNGRDGINLLQLAAGLAENAGRKEMNREDIFQVIQNGSYSLQRTPILPTGERIGRVSGLGVYGKGRQSGILLEIEVRSVPVSNGQGRVEMMGIIEEEELGNEQRRHRYKSKVRNSIDIVLAVLQAEGVYDPSQCDLYVHFNSAVPVDGPSAGLAMAIAIYSALRKIPIPQELGITGEIGLSGDVRPVGGIQAKLEAAEQSGLRQVLLPIENTKDIQRSQSVEVFGVTTLQEALGRVFMAK